MAATTIEWTQLVWNVFVGCSMESDGCWNCYAMRMARRLEEGFGVPAYRGTTKKSKIGPVWTGKINRSSQTAINMPLSLKKPKRIFVNSMSDFWHEDADDLWRREAIDIMRRTPQHAYQILTKRPQNILPIMKRMKIELLPPNVWLGATVEDHRVVDRIAKLRAVPAEIRFISVEPMTAPLGPIDLTGVHWVIAGGESGPRARPMKAKWVREVRDQCIEQNVRYFFKQWGTPRNNPLWNEAIANGQAPKLYVKMRDPIGKGGSMLDGREWKEYPRMSSHSPLRKTMNS